MRVLPGTAAPGTAAFSTRPLPSLVRSALLENPPVVCSRGLGEPRPRRRAKGVWAVAWRAEQVSDAVSPRRVPAVFLDAIESCGVRRQIADDGLLQRLSPTIVSSLVSVLGRDATQLGRLR